MGCHCQTLPLKTQSHMWKKRQKNYKRQRQWTTRKQYLADTVGLMLRWTQRNCDHVYKTRTGSTQTEPQNKEGETGTVSTPSQAVFKDWSIQNFSSSLSLIGINNKTGAPVTYLRLTVYVIKSDLKLPDPPASASWALWSHVCVTKLSLDIQTFGLI